MTQDALDPSQRRRLFRTLDAAFTSGDFGALAAALGNAPGWTDRKLPHDLGIGQPLQYAIYWSPPSLIEALIAAGANPNYDDGAGFPAIIAVLTSTRADRLEVLRLLIGRGADVNRRGANDATPLHVAVGLRDAAAIQILLDAGADPALRTRIDDATTALEDAAAAGFEAGATLLREALARRRQDVAEG